MSEAIIVRCGKCQQRLKVIPKEGPSQVKCAHCGTILRIVGTATQPQTQPNKATQREPQPQRRAAAPLDLGSGPLTFPTSQPNYAQATATSYANPTSGKGPKQSGRGNQRFPRWIFFLIGGMCVVPILCCGVLGLFVSRAKRNAKVVPIELVLKASLPPRDAFPLLGSPEKTYPSGVKSYFVRFEEPVAIPGRKMQMRVFVPSGEHADHSLPCVLIAPAGTPMLHGAALEPNDSYDAETLPYAEAGFVVIQYSIDGALPPGIDENNEGQAIQAMVRAYPIFKASGAGVVNGRNALEYATYRLKFVDPTRIHCAGHSSAGSLSLLLAAHEPRINRCIAYAAAYDLQLRMGDMSSDITARTMFPGIGEFITETSPTSHIQKFDGPVFVFHARDDSNVPFADAEAFVSGMKSAGKAVTFETTPSGDHYNSMIAPGIPTAIAWLRAP